MIPEAHQQKQENTTAGPPQSLGQRQEEVLALIAEALPNKQIDHRFGISEATIKARISKTIQITGCHNRVALALLWLRKTRHLIDQD